MNFPFFGKKINWDAPDLKQGRFRPNQKFRTDNDRRSNIVVDHLGTDTYASIYRAKNAYGANNIVVVTQAYHLYRALMIADGLGMEAGGVAADKGEYEGQTEYSVREMLARTKDWLLTLVKMPVSTATARVE